MKDSLRQKNPNGRRTFDISLGTSGLLETSVLTYIYLVHADVGAISVENGLLKGLKSDTHAVAQRRPRKSSSSKVAAMLSLTWEQALPAEAAACRALRQLLFAEMAELPARSAARISKR